MLQSSNQTFDVGRQAVDVCRQQWENQDQCKAACDELIRQLDALKDLAKASALYHKKVRVTATSFESGWRLSGWST